jgi:hypothetical protein
MKPIEVSGTSGNPGNPKETSGSSQPVQIVQGGPGMSVGLPRKPMSKVLPGPSVRRLDVPGASPVLPAGSYACPDFRRPTRSSHHFTRPSGLCWPRYINEVTTCHLRETQSVSIVCYQHDVDCLAKDIVRGCQGGAKSRAVGMAVFVRRSPHRPFLSCRSFAWTPGTGCDTMDPKTMKNVCRSNLLHITDQRRRGSRHETHNQHWSGHSQHTWLPSAECNINICFPNRLRNTRV